MVAHSRSGEEHYPRYCIYECHNCRYDPLKIYYLLDYADLDKIASCCNEAFKIATSSAAYLNNYFMLIGTDGVYSYTFEHERREDCPVCGGEALEISISREWTVDRLIEMLVEKQDMYVVLSSLSRDLCS